VIYRAVVRDNRDPQKKGRIRVTIPQVMGKKPTDWIWPVVSSGFLVLPKAGDQVWVAFEGGDEDVPVWVGKTATTTSYKSGNVNVGDVSALLERVKELEDRVSALESGKANVGHSH
jgi:hypothetical protein